MDSGSNSSSAQDLQSILSTLRQFTQGNTSVTQDQIQRAEYDSLQFDRETLQHPSLPSLVGDETLQEVRLKSQFDDVPASSRQMIDPASITIWSEGLRCVTKIATQNSQFAESIKRMMRDQRANEKHWYTERQNLKQIQASRLQRAAKAQSILVSLKTSLQDNQTNLGELEANKEKELADFDRKLYAAQQSMEVSITSELKALGVPFFGTNRDLIITEDNKLEKGSQSEDRPRFSPYVTQDQLLALRKRMVDHLEDLYRD